MAFRPALFGSPLDRLSAWHRLGERQFEALRWLQRADRAATPGPADRHAAQGIVRYFDLSVTVHHRDEEDDLHPALLESMAGSDPVCLRELVEAATAAHRALGQAWRQLRPSLVQLAAGEPVALPAAEVDALVAHCEQEFRLEDAELLPTAARLLTDDALDAFRQAMDARRVGSAPR
jgi:hemerythrin-like domain-containing protein